MLFSPPPERRETLERSLSILLPVRDDQSTLSATVHRLLDVLADLPGRFELIVIDDGSTDATIEVADELAACYPQVTAVRHSRPLGQEAAIRSGLRCSSGDIVLVHDRCGLRRIDRRTALGKKSVPAEPPLRTDLPEFSQRKPQRPNYLSRLSNLAFGK
jgi:hypothetical protein